MGNKQCCGTTSRHVLYEPDNSTRKPMKPTKHKKDKKGRHSRFNSESGAATILYMPPELIENNRASVMNEETMPSFAESAA